MVISLLAWVYISLICLLWGQLILTTVSKDRVVPIPAPLLCLVGLSIISTLALGLSLFMPLDWKAHGLLLIGPIVFCRKDVNRQAIRVQLAGMVAGIRGVALGLLIALILLLLAISVYPSSHPDTLYYHAESILCFGRYGTIPGVANLRNEMGFQSGWFASMAVFQLPFPSCYNMIFLNGAVLCWYVVFVVGRIASSGKGWAWLLLLAYSLCSWTQLRLTAASASPDFVVSLYSWGAFYIFIQAERNSSWQSVYFVLVALLCMGALLTKLSAIALLLLPLLALAGSFRLRAAKFSLVYSAIALLILFTKNWFASGYLLYPLSKPDIFHPVWKMKVSRVTDLEHYISAYARFPIAGRDVAKYWPMPIREWLPKWWQLTAVADKVLFLAILAGVVVLLISFLLYWLKGQQISAVESRKYPMLFIVSLGGCLLWFFGAPSPRFGTGFLIPFLFFLYQALPRLTRTLSLRMLGLAVGCMLLAVVSYTGYRTFFFFKASGLLFPAGIGAAGYEPLGCDQIRVDLLRNRVDVVEKAESRNCINDIGGFSPNGVTVSQGFRPVE